jgi:hypothetical protein
VPAGPKEYEKVDDPKTLKDADERSVAKHYKDKGCEVWMSKNKKEEKADFVIVCEDCTAVIEVKGGKNDTKKAGSQIQETLKQMNDQNLLPKDTDKVHPAVYAPAGLSDWDKDNPPEVKVKGKKKTVEKIKDPKSLPC